MKRERQGQTGRHSSVKFIFLSAVLTGLAVLVAAVNLLKPDWCYLAVEAMSQFGSAVELQEVSPEDFALMEYTLQELSEDDRVTMDQSMMLINTQYPLEEGFHPELATCGDAEVWVNQCLVESYEALKEKVQELYRQPLYIRSAYRTAQEQAETILEDSAVAALLNASEHQAGLALDVYIPYYAGAAFLKSEAGQYVNSNCWQYGFIIRYPYYGKAETGIGFEPWHLRYVGAPHAEIIYRNRLTLESYLDSLKVGEYYQFDGCLISRQEGELLCLPEAFRSAVVSEDHTGCYVVTVVLD